MGISRRDFLGGAAGSVGGLYVSPPLAWAGASPLREGPIDCVLFDLGSDCALRESLEGYQSALPDVATISEPRGGAQARCRIAMVPGAGVVKAATTSLLVDLLAQGSHVLLESGAAFLSSREFKAHQRMLHRCFSLSVESPVDLWSRTFTDRRDVSLRPGSCTDGSIPYVRYAWPREALVRDFSCAVPVLAKGAEVIGRLPSFPVAVKKRVANGLLIYLGSPLGPALRVGDPDARFWLRSLATF
jgi:hypothetical protein